jgi:hypothetical protein
MEWLLENWIWVIVAVLFFAMHFFGHGGHRGHHEGRRQRQEEDESAGCGRGRSRSTDDSGHAH